MPSRCRALCQAFALVATFVAVFSSARVAHADGCLPGQVATEDSQWHCCWPGQAWSEDLNRCTGAPQCPMGWYGSGAECVTAAPAAPIAPPPAAAPPPPATSPDLPPPPPRPIDLQPPREFAQDRPYAGGPIPPGAHIEQRRRKGLIISGFATLGGAYLVTLLGTLEITLGESTDNNTTCANLAALGAIPILGAAMGGISTASSSACNIGNGSWLFSLGGVVMSGVQIGGLVLGLYGLMHKDPFLVFDVPTADNGRGGFQLAIEPGTPGAPEGLSLVARF